MSPAAVFEAAAAEVGQRLDVVVATRLDESRSRAAARIDRGEVRINRRAATKSHRIEAGDHVEVASPPIAESGAAGVPVPPIRYEDEHLLVVSKPPGLVVHPGTGNRSGTLVQALQEAGYELSGLADEGRPGIVHRLDRDTSGLLVIAKSDAAYLGLVGAMRRRAVTRRYLAVVEGVPDAVRGRVDAPIARDPRERKRYAVVAGGRPAITHWEVLGAGRLDAIAGNAGRVSLLRCELETGRTHQIRVHLSYAGHAVVGDRTYGARRDIAEQLGLSRPFLHAAQLAFDHPVTGEPIEFTEPLPMELREALARAGIEPG
ncbi:MAG TPA: RluA family pseudouridine synthase [Nitriliruptorales bacterium]